MILSVSEEDLTSMVRFRTRSCAPHLIIELSGQVSGPGVREGLADLPCALASMPDGFVLLAEYPEVTLIDADAVGPLFYYVAHVFDADPGLCVFVDGGKSPHPGLRDFIKRVALDDQVVFVPTRAEADEHIRRYGGVSPAAD